MEVALNASCYPKHIRHDQVRRGDMDRRKFLAASAAAATVAIAKAASAATEGPFGETGVPLPVPPSGQLPLGPLPDTRYPDKHIESLDKRFQGSVGTGAFLAVAVSG